MSSRHRTESSNTMPIKYNNFLYGGEHPFTISFGQFAPSVLAAISKSHETIRNYITLLHGLIAVYIQTFSVIDTNPSRV